MLEAICSQRQPLFAIIEGKPEATACQPGSHWLLLDTLERHRTPLTDIGSHFVRNGSHLNAIDPGSIGHYWKQLEAIHNRKIGCHPEAIGSRGSHPGSGLERQRGKPLEAILDPMLTPNGRCWNLLAAIGFQLDAVGSHAGSHRKQLEAIGSHQKQYWKPLGAM
jgi:hypothetical protein